MDVVAIIKEWSHLILRWLHVVAGIMWIGHLYFFNFVNAQVAKSYDADSKKKVIPELMPRALYWFRWGAAWTWITGVLLLGLVIYMGGVLLPTTSTMNSGMAQGIAFGVLLVGFAIYDVLWKAMAKQEMAGMAVSFVLLVGIAAGLGRIFTGRAMLIEIGSLLGTIMAANVWMRIWPLQRKIIGAIKEGKAPDAAWPAMAGLRSKHNTYMSVPLVFLMVSNHFPTLPYLSDVDSLSRMGFIWIAVFVAAGWGIAKFCFVKSAGDAPKQF